MAWFNPDNFKLSNIASQVQSLAENVLQEDGISDQVNSLRLHNQRLKEELIRLDSELEQRDSRITELEQRDSRITELEQCPQELFDLREKLDKAVSFIKQLSLENEDLKLQLNTVSTEQLNTTEHAVSTKDVQNNTQQMNTPSTKAQDTIQQLNQEISEKSNQLLDSKHKLQTALREIAELKSQQSQKDKELISKYENEIKTLKEEAEKSRIVLQKNEELDIQHSRLKRMAAEKIKKLTLTNEALKSELEAFRNAGNVVSIEKDIPTETTRLNRENEKLKTAVAKLGTRIKTYKDLATPSFLKNVKTHLEKQLTESLVDRNEMAELENEILEIEAAIQDRNVPQANENTLQSRLEKSEVLQSQEENKKLKEELQSLHETSEALNEKISRVNSENTNLKSQILLLETQASNLGEHFSILQTENARLKKEIENYTPNNVTQTKDDRFDDLQVQVEDLKTENSELMARLASLEHDLAYMDSIKQELADAEQQKLEMKSQKEAAEVQVKTLMEKSLALENEIELLNTELNSLTDVNEEEVYARKQLETQVSNLSNQILALEGQLDESVKQIALLDGQLREKSHGEVIGEEIKQLESQLDILRKENDCKISAMEEEKVALVSQLNKLQILLEENEQKFKNELMEMRETNRVLVEENRNLKDQIREKSHSIEKLENEVKDFKTCLERNENLDLQTFKDNLELVISGQEPEMGNIPDVLKDSFSNLCDLVSNAKNLQEENEILSASQKDSSVLTTNIESLKQDIVSYCQQINDYEKAYQEQNVIIQQLSEENQQIENERSVLEAKLSQFKEVVGPKLKSEIEKNEQLASDNELFANENNQLKQELSNIFQDNQRLQQEIDAITSTLNSQQLQSQQQLSDENSKLVEEVHRLRQFLLELEENQTRDMLGLENAITEYKQQVEILEKARDEMQQLLSNESDDKKEIQERYNESKEQLLNYNLEVQELKKKLTSQNEALLNLQNVLEQFESSKEREIRLAVEAYETKFNQSLQQEWEDRYHQAQDELKALRETVSNHQSLRGELEAKDALVGKLRADVVQLQSHLSEAMRKLRSGLNDEFVDRKLISNLIVGFISAPRGTSKPFEILTVLSNVLMFDEKEQQKVGLVRGNSSQVSTDTGTENFMDMWIGFLQKESGENSLQAPVHVDPSSPLGSDTDKAVKEQRKGFFW